MRTLVKVVLFCLAGLSAAQGGVELVAPAAAGRCRCRSVLGLCGLGGRVTGSGESVLDGVHGEVYLFW